MAGHVSVALVIVMVTARSAAQAFHSPAMMALMPMLVPEKHLVRINSLDAMLLSIAGMICPALGMLLYAAVGFHAVMLLDFAGALVACAALSLAKAPATHAESEQAQQSNAQSEPSTHSGAGTTPARKPFGDMREGWQALRANRGVFLVVVFITLSMMTFGPMSALYPLMTYDYFSGDGIMAACAEGFFAGGLLVGTIIIMIWGGGKKPGASAYRVVHKLRPVLHGSGLLKP